MLFSQAFSCSTLRLCLILVNLHVSIILYNPLNHFLNKYERSSIRLGTVIYSEITECNISVCI